MTDEHSLTSLPDIIRYSTIQTEFSDAYLSLMVVFSHEVRFPPMQR